jgi:hypothetical protein
MLAFSSPLLSSADFPVLASYSLRWGSFSTKLFSGLFVKITYVLFLPLRDDSCRGRVFGHGRTGFILHPLFLGTAGSM